ncbi:Protein of unknown function [Octadecabacter temperatus]|uniref:Uncharacterized protein n=1 Tax=Octadecabacter temperatus TaxID=1458307 RepID=A0A0K0Y3W9_9RHOB|nr:DUF2867 domain-containing protein [Octadecabacter temperatus]AKS45625.1 hypothetical protein OSB_10680 [Octadecabacter temperatus]SIN97105.1 Protein of unknown function [Octadecabacter temperatus]
MPLVLKTPLPKTSHLWTHVQTGDFIDGYCVAAELPPKLAAEIGLTMPAWANFLLALRNKIVAPLGLKTETDASSGDSENLIFPTTYESVDEIILGTDDKHLNFRIAVRREAGMIHMATWVHRNNLMGRIYLGLVMPFHILIVRDAMRRIARHGTAAPIASPPSTH